MLLFSFLFGPRRFQFSRRLTMALAYCLGSVVAAAGEPKTVLLIGQGPDGHPPATHEFRSGLRILETCLAKRPDMRVRQVLADEPWADGPELLRQADGVVLYLSEGARWTQADPRRYAALTELASRRGGIVALHWAVGCKEEPPIEGFLRLVGGCHGGADRKYQVLDAELTPEPDHPALRGIKPFRVRDEFYYHLKFNRRQGTLAPLVQAMIDGNRESVAWAWSREDGGRSCGFSGLHFHDNWSRPEYRRLVVQMVLWSLDRPIPENGVDVEVPAEALELSATK